MNAYAKDNFNLSLDPRGGASYSSKIDKQRIDYHNREIYKHK
jgi:hypothetical protein